MMIALVIFCTVHGIKLMSDLKKIGRIGVKTFYFEVRRWRSSSGC